MPGEFSSLSSSQVFLAHGSINEKDLRDVLTRLVLQEEPFVKDGRVPLAWFCEAFNSALCKTSFLTKSVITAQLQAIVKEQPSRYHAIFENALENCPWKARH